MASIKKRSEGSYQITVSAGYDYFGKKIIRTQTYKPDPGMTQKQIEKELLYEAALFERQVQSGKSPDGSRMTLADFCTKWFTDYAEKNLQPKTIYEYRSLMERILPTLGHLKLDRIMPSHLIEFYNNLAEKGIRKQDIYIALPELASLVKKSGMKMTELAAKAGIHEDTLRGTLKGESTKKADEICNALQVKKERVFKLKDEPYPLSSSTIRHYHRFLSSVLTSAVQWQLIPSNPASRVKPPKASSAEAAHYDEELTETVLLLLENEPLKYRVMTALTIFAGLRRGELCGLEWPDVDFKNDRLTVRRASQHLPGKGTFTKVTKNISSMRTMALPSIAVDLLRKYKIWQAEEKLKCSSLWVREWDDHPRLFTQWNGKPIYPGTISIWFKEFRKKHNLPELSFHGLRHTNASLLIGKGVDIVTVSKRLGHANPTITTTIYAHALRRPDIEAAETLEKLFNENKNGRKVIK